MTPTLSVQNLRVDYELVRAGLWRPAKRATAIDGVSFDIAPGETLGLVGESGSGKTTAGRAILRRVDATQGRILFKGQDITDLRGESLRRLRAGMQLVLQDPYTSLNPRMRVGETVAEPLIVHDRVRSAAEARERVRALLDLVGLPQDAHERYPYS